MNLNVFGALAGAFSSNSSKETAEDGSSLETEEKHAGVKGRLSLLVRFGERLLLLTAFAGAGAANVNAAAAANAEKSSKSRRELED